MSNERFDRLEKMIEQNQGQINQLQTMMEQLIKMVGTNNASIEELRQDNKEIKQRLDSLESRFDNLESQMQTGFEGLTSMVNLLGEKAEAIPRIETKLNILAERSLDHEADLRLLKRVR